MAVVEWTIDLGQLLIIGTVLLSGVGLFYGLRERVSLIEDRVTRLESQLHDVSEIQKKNINDYLPILAKLTMKVLNGK
jgi:hypothetical protein